MPKLPSLSHGMEIGNETERIQNESRIVTGINQLQ